MNTYQIEQLEALRMVRQRLSILKAPEMNELQAEISDYRSFRSRVADFYQARFKALCTDKCFRNELSACCSKDGIIVFFADVVVNALISGNDELDAIENGIRHPASPFKCIFLSDTGCLWHLKPIVCEMFLCDSAKETAFDHDPDASRQWEALLEMKKRYTWPDKPVLFELLESRFMATGCDSPLMHIHKSPGLLRIKNKRGK